MTLNKNMPRTNLIMLGLMTLLYISVILASRIYLDVSILITLAFITIYIVFTYKTYKLLFSYFVYKQKSPEEILEICKTKSTRKTIIMYIMFVIIGLSWVLLFAGIASESDPHVSVYTPPIKILPSEYYMPNHLKYPFIFSILVIGWISMVFSFALETYLTATKMEKILAN